MRQQTVSRLIGYMDTAHRFGAVLTIGLLQGLRTDEPDSEIANDRIVNCLQEVAAAAEDKVVELVLEPVNHLQVGFNNSVGEVRAIIDRVGSPALKPMADTIHMNIEERDPLDCIRELGESLRHFHLCESNGSLLGSGNIDLAGVWQTLLDIGYQQFVSIKIYRGARWEEGARSAIEFLDGLRTESPATQAM